VLLGVVQCFGSGERRSPFPDASSGSPANRRRCP
jgi:hypothetical protein